MQPSDGAPDDRGMPMTFAEPRPARIAAIGALLIAPLANCTCAGAQRQHAYQAHLQSELDAYAHAGPRETVAEDARGLLVDRGFDLSPWDGRAAATTDWRPAGDASRERYRVEATAQGGGTAIRYLRERQDRDMPRWTRDARTRDAQLEHEILGRIHPTRAEHVKIEDAGTFVYDVATPLLWEETRAALQERGEMFESYDPPVDVTTTTLWVVHDGDDPSRTRHDVELVSEGAGRHRLVVHRTIERGAGPRRWITVEEHRDWDAELDLVRRRDPTAAGTIEADAERKGQEAFDAALERGAPSCGAW